MTKDCPRCEGGRLYTEQDIDGSVDLICISCGYVVPPSVEAREAILKEDAETELFLNKDGSNRKPRLNLPYQGNAKLSKYAVVRPEDFE